MPWSDYHILEAEIEIARVRKYFKHPQLTVYVLFHLEHGNWAWSQ